MDPQQPSETVEATVRRVPRYGVFMGMGAILGVVAALVATTIGDPSQTPGAVVYSAGQVFGFTLVYAVPIGIGLGALVAIVLDRIVGRRRRTVRVQHERIIAAPDDEPEARA